MILCLRKNLTGIFLIYGIILNNLILSTAQESQEAQAQQVQEVEYLRECKLHKECSSWEACCDTSEGGRYCVTRNTAFGPWLPCGLEIISLG